MTSLPGLKIPVNFWFTSGQNSLLYLEWILVKTVQSFGHYRLASDWNDFFAFLQAFFNLGKKIPKLHAEECNILSNFRSIIIGNFFLNANIFTETTFLQNLIYTSDCVFAKIIKCIAVIALASAFIRKTTTKSVHAPISLFCSRSPLIN
jgi:hypothetical protein